VRQGGIRPPTPTNAYAICSLLEGAPLPAFAAAWQRAAMAAASLTCKFRFLEIAGVSSTLLSAKPAPSDPAGLGSSGLRARYCDDADSQSGTRPKPSGCPPPLKAYTVHQSAACSTPMQERECLITAAPAKTALKRAHALGSAWPRAAFLYRKCRTRTIAASPHTSLS
jgi:hypothetical protein